MQGKLRGTRSGSKERSFFLTTTSIMMIISASNTDGKRLKIWWWRCQNPTAFFQLAFGLSKFELPPALPPLPLIIDVSEFLIVSHRELSLVQWFEWTQKELQAGWAEGIILELEKQEKELVFSLSFDPLSISLFSSPRLNSFFISQWPQ